MGLAVDLSGRVALVTGGTKGVGRGIAGRLVDAGATVVVCGRSTPDDDHGVEFVAANVRDPIAVASMVELLVTEHGRLDILVNNAGGAPPAVAATASPRFAASIVDLNLVAALTCAQRANAVMQHQDGGGCIVNVASVSGLRPSPGTAAYGAAKAGLINLTASLAVEWAPKVRVNCVTPGLVLTEQSELHYGNDLAAIEATVPLGRLADPRDIGDAVAFLASPLASYISGANLVVHGGGEPPAFLNAVGEPEPPSTPRNAAQPGEG